MNFRVFVQAPRLPSDLLLKLLPLSSWDRPRQPKLHPPVLQPARSRAVGRNGVLFTKAFGGEPFFRYAQAAQMSGDGLCPAAGQLLVGLGAANAIGMSEDIEL